MVTVPFIFPHFVINSRAVTILPSGRLPPLAQASLTCQSAQQTQRTCDKHHTNASRGPSNREKGGEPPRAKDSLNGHPEERMLIFVSKADEHGSIEKDAPHIGDDGLNKLRCGRMKIG